MIFYYSGNACNTSEAEHLGVPGISVMLTFEYIRGGTRKQDERFKAILGERNAGSDQTNVGRCVTTG